MAGSLARLRRTPVASIAGPCVLMRGPSDGIDGEALVVGSMQSHCRSLTEQGQCRTWGLVSRMNLDELQIGERDWCRDDGGK
jgi:hypothetical protein